MMRNCLALALTKHENQIRRDSGIPYIVHPIRVAELVRKYSQGMSFDPPVSQEEMWCAAILHDTLEDTSITEDEIKEVAGEVVLRLVKELTSDEEELKRVGKAKYIHQKIKNMSSAARYIKLCDRLDNVNDYHISTITTKSVKDIERARLYAIATLEFIDDDSIDWACNVFEEVENGGLRHLVKNAAEMLLAKANESLSS
jgi:(p)ppGpp synthase/HD superfamily hydrolase